MKFQGPKDISRFVDEIVLEGRIPTDDEEDDLDIDLDDVDIEVASHGSKNSEASEGLWEDGLENTLMEDRNYNDTMKQLEELVELLNIDIAS